MDLVSLCLFRQLGIEADFKCQCMWTSMMIVQQLTSSKYSVIYFSSIPFKYIQVRVTFSVLGWKLPHQCLYTHFSQRLECQSKIYMRTLEFLLSIITSPSFLRTLGRMEAGSRKDRQGASCIISYWFFSTLTWPCWTHPDTYRAGERWRKAAKESEILYLKWYSCKLFYDL